MKKSPLKRKTASLKRVGFKRPKLRKEPVNARRVAKQAKKPTLKTLRNKCDKFLTPIIISMYPNCLLCPFTERVCSKTQVAHHHVHKSKSSRLRYYIPNLIPLCHQCHLMLHNNESFWASKIVEIKGIEWFQGLEKKKNEIVKVDRFFYERHLKELEDFSPHNPQS